jgi:hypothetical protein
MWVTVSSDETISRSDPSPSDDDSPYHIHDELASVKDYLGSFRPSGLARLL